MKLQKLGPVGPSGVLGVRRIAAAFERKDSRQKLESSSFEFGFQQLLLVLRGPLPFVGDHARSGRRNSRLPRRAPRLFALVDFLSALPHGA